MTRICDIVSIDSQAVLSNAIQLSWFGDTTLRKENERLAAGFVFGNRATRRVGGHSESSSLPLFEAIRDAFGNPNASNIFTVVANYGHGKSHFALVLANYFGHAVNAPVTEKIIDHIETCSDRVTADHFRNYKKQTVKPHLVVTLSGHEFLDLRQGLLRALRRSLDANEATRNQPIRSVSTRAVAWLSSLTPDQVKIAEAFLNSKYNTDIESLINSLENFASGNDLVIKELSKELNGIEANFGADANLKEVITDIVDTYCNGAEAPFHRLLILFDELGIYSEKWCHNRAAAGGLAPQEIFEACHDRRGKVCFVGFVQRELGEFVKDFSAVTQADFQKWAGRMPPDAVYLLVSNLEEVISKLIIKKPKWKDVISDFSPRLLDESRVAHASMPRYSQSWDENSFYANVTKDCFPLHPLTTGILCSLDFTQGNRTIIGVVDSLIQNAQSRDVSANGVPSWVRAVELVSEFEASFEQKGSRDFAAYDYAVRTALTADADQILLDILRALFLFKEVRMTKNQHGHAEIIAQLAGYTLHETEIALKRLKDDYDAVRYSPQRREYEFTGMGSSRVVVLDMARSATVGKRIHGMSNTLSSLGILSKLIPVDSEAREFKSEFGIEGDEWYLDTHYIDAIKLSSDEIKRLAKLTADSGKARGIVVNLLSLRAPELSDARNYAMTVIEELKDQEFTYPFVIGVPREAAEGLEKHLLEKEYLTNGMSQPQRVQLADSYRAANEYIDKELTEELIQHLQSIDYVLAPELRLRIGTRHKSLDEIADILFEESYRFRPPSNSVSMKPTGSRGNTATAEIARQLILDELNFEALDTEKQNIVRQVLTEGTNRWGILNSKYRICEPKNARVKEAWSGLTKNISEDGWTTFDRLVSLLCQPPFGYDDYTSTLLISAWIGKHKYELGFKDSRIAESRLGNAGQRANTSVLDLQTNLSKSKDFIKYLRSRISVQHSGQSVQLAATDFLERSEIVRGIEEAETLIKEGERALQALSPSDPLRLGVDNGIVRLRTWISATRNIESDLSQLQQSISKTEDIGLLLKSQTKLTELGANDDVRQRRAFIETLKFVDTKIESSARSLSGTRLTRIEGLDALKEKLDAARQASQHYGRADLAEQFDSALVRIEAEHARLKGIAEEQPVYDELRTIKTTNMPLAYLIEKSERCSELIAQFPTGRVASVAAKASRDLDKEIERLRAFVTAISSRIKQAKTSTDVEKIRTDILRHDSIFNDVPEQTELAVRLREVDKKLTSLRNEEQKTLEAAQAQQRRKLEELRANAIASEFKKIESASERFTVLKEILGDRKVVDELSPEERLELRGLLK